MLQIIKVLVCTTFIINSWSATSLTMDKNPHKRVTLSALNLGVEDSSREREYRNNYNISYRQLFLLKTKLIKDSFFKENSFFGYQIDLGMDKDELIKSQLIDIRENFFDASFKINYAFVYLFRYTLAVGPGVIYSVTKASIPNDNDSLPHSEFNATSNANFSVDYKVIDNWEVSFLLKHRYRFSGSKNDLGYGLGVSFSF